VDQIDRDGRRLVGAPRWLVRAEESNGDQLSAWVVAGLATDAVMAGLLEGECPALGQVVVGGEWISAVRPMSPRTVGSVRSTIFALGGAVWIAAARRPVAPG
jgi:hypothetical protein